MKTRNSAVLAFLILAASVIFVLAATEVVTNGDFSAGLSSWITDATATAVTDDIAVCGDEVAKVTVDASASADFVDGAITQCIENVDSLLGADETGWILRADIRKVNANAFTQVGVTAEFYNNANCAGGSPAYYTVALGTSTTTPDLVTMSATGDRDPNPNSSVKIIASVETPGGSIGVACFDNISLTAADPNAVGLSGMDARSPAQSSWLIVIAISAVVILVAATMLVRQRLTVRRD